MIPLRARLIAEIKVWAKRLALASLILLIAGIFGGLFVLISGIVPIKASSGHWAITAAILDFAKRRSVNTHTMRVKVPPLEDRDLVLKGAGHYDFACEPCHGSPVLQQPRIARRMTPTPPDLRTAALTFDPEELFYIIKHGIKFTGMPAWPAEGRDDEIWAMVAFMKTLPTLERTAYDELTGNTAAGRDDQLPVEDLLGPTPSAPDAVTGNCARCHGMDGLGRGSGAFPRLAGQRVEYLTGSMVAYATGARHSGVMEPVAANLGKDDIDAISKYYAGLPPAGPAAANADANEIELGRRLAEEGDPGRLVPACRECHGPGVPRNLNYPRLSGQYEQYIALQLSLFRGRHRGGTPFQEIMLKIAGQLTEEQVRAVSKYYASLPGERD